MKVGFTGTKDGMTEKQKQEVFRILQRLEPTEFHHGDCVGADADAHKIADGIGVKVIVHPPENTSKRAYCLGFEVREPRAYILRNHDIVDDTEVLVATPRGATEEIRSGTWATIRYAVKSNKNVVIVHPDGSMELRPAK